MKAFKTTLTLTSCTLVAASAIAGTITPGNLIIYRVGDGSAALSAAATAVFLDEYTPLGTLVQSFALPTTGASALTAVGTSTTEGIMSVALNGTPQAKVIFAGYRADVGSTLPGTFAKAIGTVGLNGLPDTASFAITDGGTGVPRSAASTDGSSLFYLGTSTGVRYVGTPGPAATSTLIDSRNSRQALLSANNKLFASNGSTSTANKIQSYGILPTGSTTPTAEVVLTTADVINGFLLLDLSPTVPGDDTIYALNIQYGQLQKYTYNGSAWSPSGSLASTAVDLTGYADASGVQLYLTGPTTLYSFFDASGYAANITGSLTTLAAAGNNTAFRGISVIPEPSTFCLALAGLATLLVARRRS